MNENTLFELTLFDPENTLISRLEKQNIEFTKVPVTRKFVVAMDETIKIISSDNNESLIDNLVLIFMDWLKENSNRRLQVMLVDATIVIIDNNDIEGIASILQRSLKITAFDPEYNNRILNQNSV
ncbi:hypothetical protein L3081_05440 [Colwellia sp. MSW7]|uniref:Uncharacterized protein n=1 Tax=Colwellia maritima TaxID=2912588 RepID=A0ABS9WY59_9GAMM|nr:hypothetical protein [Colwellia maritima]MCI2282935.1 hypothetical protein [Colwellia maritima]